MTESKDNITHAYTELDPLVGDWMNLPDVAEAMDVSITKVHALIQDGSLAEVRRAGDHVRVIPALFMDGDKPLDSLKGTLAVLRDAGYSDLEALRWLFTEDETLPGRPVDALRNGRKTEIRRRAQALGW